MKSTLRYAKVVRAQRRYGNHRINASRYGFSCSLRSVESFPGRVILVVPAENRTRTQCNGTRTRNKRDAITEISTRSELVGTSEYEYRDSEYEYRDAEYE